MSSHPALRISIVRFLALGFVLAVLAGCNSSSADTPAPRAESFPIQLPAAPTLSTDSRAQSAPVAPTSPLPTPVPRQMTDYRGLSAYLHDDEFEVTYDASVWRYIEPDPELPSPRSPRLEHRLIDDCSLDLQAWDGEPLPIGAAQLAGITWNISGLRNAISYNTSTGRGFSLRATMPEPFTPDAKNPCQQVAEEIIDTFRVIPAQPESPLAFVPTPTPTLHPTTAGDPGGGSLWPIYTTERGGFSFRYPSGWRVEENTAWLGITVIPPSGAQFETISFYPLTFEKPEEADLADWLESYYRTISTPAFISTDSQLLTEVALFESTPAGPSEQLHFADSPPPWQQGFYITQGRLVYKISTWTQSEAQTERLYAIARSLEFTDAAPATLEALNAPAPPPAYTTIEEYLAFLHAPRLVDEAFWYRIQTGETPTHILEQMSDEEVEAYELRLETQADYVESVDISRERQAADAALAETRCVKEPGILYTTLAPTDGPVEANLWLWQPDETQQLSHPEFTGILLRPTLSRDGDSMAYVMEFDPGRLRIRGIICGGGYEVLGPDTIAELDRGEHETIRVHQFDWLPDGSGLIFNTAPVVAGWRFNDDLYHISLGEYSRPLERTQLFAPGEGGQFEFSPDGSTLAVVSPHRIRLMSTATLETVQLFDYTQVPTHNAFDFYAPLVWPEDGLGPIAVIPAPDGWMPAGGIPLASMEGRFQEPAQLWRLPLDGSAPAVMAEVPNRGPYLWVSPNLQHIISSELVEWRDPIGPDNGDGTIVRLLHLDANTGETQLLYEGNLIDEYQWLVDGHTLFLKVQSAPSSYRLVNLLTYAWETLPPEQEPAHWLDDQQYLFRPRGNIQELWLGDRAGNQSMIFRADGYLVHFWPWPDPAFVPAP